MHRSIREADIFYAETLLKAKKENQERAVLRYLATHDLWFLMTRVLGRSDMKEREEINPQWLFDRCFEVQVKPDGMLDLWAREHYKSTIITFGKTIQDILINPEETVGIFSHTRPIAKGFLGQIKREFEGNEVLKDLFKDVLWENPKRDAPSWSLDAGITVQRKTNPKEATIEAHGLVDGQPTSRHFSLLIYDDVVTRESVTTPEMIDKVTEAWALSLNLGAHGGKQRYIGTRYHFNDTYRTILERQSATPRIHAATKNGEPDGEPVFLRKEDLEKKRRDQGPYVFGCQMLQNPKADSSMGFEYDWLRFYDPRIIFDFSEMNRYILVDPANEKSKKSDFTVMIVIGLADDGNFYVIDGVRDRLRLTERADLLFKLHKRWKPIGVAYEQYGMQSDIQHFEYIMQQKRYHFDLIKVGGNMNKNDRIRRLVPLFDNRRMFLPGVMEKRDYEGKLYDFTKLFVDNEYVAFPVCQHDDMLDCLSRICEPELNAFHPESDESMVAGDLSMAENDYDIFGEYEDGPEFYG